MQANGVLVIPRADSGSPSSKPSKCTCTVQTKREAGDPAGSRGNQSSSPAQPSRGYGRSRSRVRGALVCACTRLDSSFTVTSDQKRGELKQQKLILPQSGGQKPEPKVRAAVAPSGGSEGRTGPGLPPGSPWLLATLGLWPHHSSLCLQLHRHLSSVSPGSSSPLTRTPGIRSRAPPTPG